MAKSVPESRICSIKNERVALKCDSFRYVMTYLLRREFNISFYRYIISRNRIAFFIDQR